jgi:hypothetical protein
MAMPQLVCDDVLHWAETYQGAPFHALLCDAPYSLGDGKSGFMGKRWDTDIAFRPDTWRALAQHLLPGAFGMTFGSSRGWHRLAYAIEDAGLIIHPSVFFLGWAFGSGFPKSTRIDTAVDKAAGAEREVLGTLDTRSMYDGNRRTSQALNSSWRDKEGRDDIQDLSQKIVTAPATDLAKTWAGHRYGGQVLKPALEPVIVWQKPYHGRPVDSITATGAGAVWIDGARVGAVSNTRRPNGKAPGGFPHNDDAWMPHLAEAGHLGKRWPPNLALLHLPTCQPRGPQQRQVRSGTGGTNNEGRMHGYKGASIARRTDNHPGHAAPDGTEVVQAYDCAPECPVAAFDRQAGNLHGAGYPCTGKFPPGADNQVYGHNVGGHGDRYGDTGPASRFMYRGLGARRGGAAGPGRPGVLYRQGVTGGTGGGALWDAYARGYAVWRMHDAGAITPADTTAAHAATQSPSYY